jgi:cytochrome c oxidase assembly protein Cox11
MAVSFYVDPAFVEDEIRRTFRELTYTFYLVSEPQPKKSGQTAASGTDGGG